MSYVISSVCGYFYTAFLVTSVITTVVSVIFVFPSTLVVTVVSLLPSWKTWLEFAFVGVTGA